MCPKAIKPDELIRETKADHTLQNVIKMINKEKFVESEEIKIFKTLLDQLTVSSNGLIINILV